MSKYHINFKGVTGACDASQGGCPFGGESDHYDSPAEARSAYESHMASQALPETLRKTKVFIPSEDRPDSHRVVMAALDEVAPALTGDNLRFNDRQRLLRKAEDYYNTTLTLPDAAVAVWLSEGLKSKEPLGDMLSHPAGAINAYEGSYDSWESFADTYGDAKSGFADWRDEGEDEATGRANCVKYLRESGDHWAREGADGQLHTFNWHETVFTSY